MLFGCGKEEAQVTCIEVASDGSIKNVIYEEFNEGYYDINELSDMASKEVSAFNSDYLSPKVSLEEVALVDEGSFARVAMTYKSSSDYSHFNQVTLFYGTLQEAVDKGYGISDKMADKTGDPLGSDFLDSHKDRHIVITTDRSNIRTPYNIEYMTGGVTLLNKKEAVLQDADSETVQLLLSK
ncbi:MAG: hypothetical protein K6G10_12870 [Butyrivibrio sp.]|nr:hypothetical protein [Butyrivibrio sp.]